MMIKSDSYPKVRRMRLVMSIWAIAGFSVPVLFTGLLGIANYQKYPDFYFVVFDEIRPILWPASLGYLGLGNASIWSGIAWAATVMLTLLNIITYLAVGFLLRGMLSISRKFFMVHK